LHEALQRVDAAEADVDGGGAEVGDGGVVPVGDLALFGDLELQPRFLELAVGCPDGQGGEDEGYQRGEAG